MSVDRRSFSQKKRAEIVLRQNGRCAMCGSKLQPGKFEIDHIAALIHSGTNDDDNLRAICAIPCHRNKSRADVHARAKADRIAAGGKQRRGRPFPGSRASNLKKHFDGTVTRR